MINRIGNPNATPISNSTVCKFNAKIQINKKGITVAIPDLKIVMARIILKSSLFDLSCFILTISLSSTKNFFFGGNSETGFSFIKRNPIRPAIIILTPPIERTNKCPSCPITVSPATSCPNIRSATKKAAIAINKPEYPIIFILPFALPLSSNSTVSGINDLSDT